MKYNTTPNRITL